MEHKSEMIADKSKMRSGSEVGSYAESGTRADTLDDGNEETTALRWHNTVSQLDNDD